MSTPADIAALEAWLAQAGPGGVLPEPPPGLDPEVVEAVLALAPGRAPPARVSVEDVLAVVGEGPLFVGAAEAAAAARFAARIDATDSDAVDDTTDDDNSSSSNEDETVA